jgi:hypothetical protein
VTNSARLPSLPGARRRPSLRTAPLAALLVTLACLLFSASAGAVVTEVEGLKVGLQPRSTGLAKAWEKPETFTNENGNVVLHGSNDYAIYWDPSKQFHHEWLVRLDGFFQALGEAGLSTGFADLGQYRDRSNAVTPFQALFKGAYSDTTKFPPHGCTDPKPLEKGAVTCLTSQQLREQLQSFIATHGLPKGMSTVYYLLTPPGVTVCLDAAATSCSDFKLSKLEEEEETPESASYKNSFCSYHGNINPDAAVAGDESTILFAAIPWTAGTSGIGGEYTPAAHVYQPAFDCQDGGFNPEKHEEKQEAVKAFTKAEEEALEKDTTEQREEAEKAHFLEGPHQEESSQKGRGEAGDYGQALSDVLVNQIAEEQMNIVTDPLLSAWHDAAGNEVTDMCRNYFDATAGPTGGQVTGSVTADPFTEAGTLANTLVGPGSYYVNNIFNRATGVCVGGVGLVPRFTAPNPVNAGEIVGVDGMESSISLYKADAFGASGPPTTTYGTFSWNFGDGTPEVTGFAPGAPTCEAPWLSPCAASAFHSYQYGGTYVVTLTITDVAGHKASVNHAVVVVGPPPPSSSPASGGGSGSSAAASSATPPGGSIVAPGPPPVPAPVAAYSVISRTLRSVAKNGVVVRYSVNEQVAGHFDVLLNRSVARRLGISGPLAVGLPSGSPPQLVIAKAILVTTAGGRSTVKIQLSKRTCQHLARQAKTTLMLRLVVRNSARTPSTTTVLSTFTLSR